MAAVDEARRTGEGPFRAISPIFRLALEPQRNQLLNINAAVNVLTPILGENFTEHTLEAFIPQLVDLKWLVEERANPSLAAYRVPSDLPFLDQEVAVEASELKLIRLFTAFQEFLESYAPLLKNSMDKQEFSWLLFRWATSLDGSDKQAIRAEADRLNSGGKSSIKNAFLDETQRFSKINKSTSVEFAGFVKWLSKHKRDELTDIASLTELGLAIEFIDELRRTSNAHKTINSTVFVLDAPVLLDALGLSGPARKSSIDRCLKVVTKNGGRLATLTHCLEEISEILKAVLERPDYRRFGLTGDALRANPELSLRASEVMKQPDRAAKLAGLEILHFDRKSPLSANCFPDELIDRFRNTATWHDLYKSEQRERDAYSIAYIMRRRNGRSDSDIMENAFVFVTRNSTFTSFSDIFVKKHLSVPDYAFGPAIETKTLAALVWLRFGSVDTEELPQIHLISACERILSTNGELLRRAEKRIKEFKSDDAAAALLSSQQAVLDLVITVGGSPDVLDGADGDQLIRAFTVSAEEKGRLDERAKAALREAELSEAISKAETLAETQSLKAADLALEKIRMEGVVRRKDIELREIITQEDDRINEIANRMVVISQDKQWRKVAAIWIILALIGVLGQFFIWQGVDWWLKSYSNMVFGALVVFATVVATGMGLRVIPPGKIDLAGGLHTILVRKSLNSRLRDMEHDGDRERVRKVLQANFGRL
jgi:hypothetical protein